MCVAFREGVCVWHLERVCVCVAFREGVCVCGI